MQTGLIDTLARQRDAAELAARHSTDPAASELVALCRLYHAVLVDLSNRLERQERLMAILDRVVRPLAVRALSGRGVGKGELLAAAVMHGPKLVEALEDCGGKN
jgi:hypothetical protein